VHTQPENKKDSGMEKRSARTVRARCKRYTRIANVNLKPPYRQDDTGKREKREKKGREGCFAVSGA